MILRIKDNYQNYIAPNRNRIKVLTSIAVFGIGTITFFAGVGVYCHSPLMASGIILGGGGGAVLCSFASISESILSKFLQNRRKASLRIDQWDDSIKEYDDTIVREAKKVDINAITTLIEARLTAIKKNSDEAQEIHNVTPSRLELLPNELLTIIIEHLSDTKALCAISQLTRGFYEFTAPFLIKHFSQLATDRQTKRTNYYAEIHGPVLRYLFPAPERIPTIQGFSHDQLSAQYLESKFHEYQTPVIKGKPVDSNNRFFIIALMHTMPSGKNNFAFCYIEQLEPSYHDNWSIELLEGEKQGVIGVIPKNAVTLRADLPDTPDKLYVQIWLKKILRREACNQYIHPYGTPAKEGYQEYPFEIGGSYKLWQPDAEAEPSIKGLSEMSES